MLPHLKIRTIFNMDCIHTVEQLYLLLDFGLGLKFFGVEGLGLYLYVPMCLKTVFLGTGAGKMYLLLPPKLLYL